MISYGATRIFGASLGLAFSAMAALAQQPAPAPAPAQQAAPEIPFDSIPDPLKLPPNMYFGEATGVAVNSKKHVFVFSRGNTSGPAYAAGAAQLLSSDPMASSSVKLARIFMPGRLRMRCASTDKTTSGRSTKART